jgi:hypothetical protein
VITHKVAQQQTFSVSVAVGEALCFGLGGVDGGDGLTPLQPGTPAVAGLDDRPVR